MNLPRWDGIRINPSLDRIQVVGVDSELTDAREVAIALLTHVAIARARSVAAARASNVASTRTYLTTFVRPPRPARVRPSVRPMFRSVRSPHSLLSRLSTLPALTSPSSISLCSAKKEVSR